MTVTALMREDGGFYDAGALSKAEAQAQGHQLKFYTCPGDAWEAMLAECQAAEVSIEFDQYILRHDSMGLKFMKVFTDKVRAGVKVRLSLDTIGSRSIRHSQELKTLREAGGKVYFFNNLNWFNLFMPWTWFPRNHCKTMLIDDKIAFIGSVCVDEDMRQWRDTHMRYTGPMIQDIARDFARLWLHFRQHWIGATKRVALHDAPFQYMTSRPGLGVNPIYRQLLREILRAKHNVCLVTPYFLPPFRLRRAMKRAVKRGVDVRVIMSEVSDVRVADLVAHSYFPQLLRKGIRIFLYRGTVMHAKYNICDDGWATIGSTNLDYLSLRRNREANVVIRDPQTIADIRRQFDIDIDQCIEIDKNYWRNLSFRDRITGYLGRFIKRML